MIFNRVKLLMLLLITAMAANAEESLKESPFSASLELSTKYMWRGIEYGTAPTLFPMIGYNTHGFNAFAMGGYAIDGSHQEVDLGVSYTASEFTVGVSDYYYPSSVGEKDQYFKLSNRETGHWVEAYATWAGTLEQTKMQMESRCILRMLRLVTPTPLLKTIISLYV